MTAQAEYSIFPTVGSLNRGTSTGRRIHGVARVAWRDLGCLTWVVRSHSQ